jgi:dTDP-4-amino-4,6-dideoxygalactose transaminase
MSELAILGGPPVRSEPFPEWPIVEEDDVQAVAEVVRSGRWGRLGASQVHDFEQAFAAYQGASYGLGVNSGGCALELALMSLHLPRGAEVLVPAYTYMATATCILRVGLTPVFVDIDEDTYNIDPTRLESAVTDQTGAILVVHFGGLSCDMDAVLAVARAHDLRVVEDSAHAHGARWRDSGLGTIGDIGCFSFQASKNLNAGEGGMFLTNNAELYTRAIEYHDLWAGGMLEREGQIGQGSMRSGATWDYPVAASSNRLPTYQAVLLHRQLARLEAQTELRAANGAYLDGLLDDLEGIQPRRQDPWVTRNSQHLYICRYDASAFDGLPRETFIQALNAEGIPVAAGYGRALHRTALFQDRDGELARFWSRNNGVPDIDYADAPCPVAERLCANETLWLSQNVFLDTHDGMTQIAEAIEKIRASVTDFRQAPRM